ncbi:hypothetical protein [Desulfobacter postgatei]|uniref:Uncharacterized protein n=1 Tax=Desulfobacter postgatei 2ac9 TaxID=879212 RepID=I5B2S5_9BACT|nr:hypothetical protein [Desulfobacter postgatei]EIM63788.1 hypothetical protein DespoDRAFT_01878 [Desulfobacter postgatei 2ac9]
MKKAEATLISWLIIIGIIVSSFTWLSERVGGIGIGIIVAMIIGLAIFVNIRKTMNDQKSFDDLARYVFNNRLHPDEDRKINSKLARSNFHRAALIRNLQIIRDSIDIALSSKKRDTAESRMNLLLERFEEIKKEQSALISFEVFDEISNVIQKTSIEFNTKLYYNIAVGYIEKAESLKTKKSKEKYLDLAKDILDEGIEKGKGNGEELKRVLLMVEQAKTKSETYGT